MNTTAILILGVLAMLAIGLYGLLVSRNLIKLVIALQILVKAAILGLIAAGYASGRVILSQSLAVTVIVADTVVAVIALALIVQVRRQFGELDAADLSTLKG